MRARLAPLTWPIVVALAAAMWFGRAHRDLPDFEVYRTAGARAARAEPLYHPDDGHWQFKYLPAFAVAMIPVAALPGDVERPLWFAGSVVLLWIFVSRSVDLLPEPRRTHRALVWAAVLLLGRFYVQELDLGQTNILLGLVLIAALEAIGRRQPYLAGALVGVAVFIKPYALLFVPWLPIAAGWTAVGAAAGVLAAGLTAPALVYGWSGNLVQLGEWLRTVTQTTTPNLAHPENISLAAMWSRWLDTAAPAQGLAWLSSAALLVVAAWVVSRRRTVPAPAYLEFGLLALLIPLLSPQGWDYVLLVATPAVLVLVNVLPRVRQPLRALAWLALLVVALTIFDLLGRVLYAAAMDAAVVSVAALILVAQLAHVRQKSMA